MANTFAFFVLLIEIFHNSYWNKIRHYITGVWDNYHVFLYDRKILEIMKYLFINYSFKVL
jgi:hypothetical protein